MRIIPRFDIETIHWSIHCVAFLFSCLLLALTINTFIYYNTNLVTNKDLIHIRNIILSV